MSVDGYNDNLMFLVSKIAEKQKAIDDSREKDRSLVLKIHIINKELADLRDQRLKDHTLHYDLSAELEDLTKNKEGYLTPYDIAELEEISASEEEL